MRRAVWKRFGEYLEQKKVDMGLFVSKINRDHDIEGRAKLETNSDLFKSLCREFKTDFNNGSGSNQLIPKKDGLFFNLSLNKSGHMRLFINQFLDWDTFLKQFHRKFINLPFEQFSQLLELFENERSKLFYTIETANLIGPRPVVDANYKGSFFTIKKMYSRGKRVDIDVKVDYSEEEPEVDMRGEEHATRKLQDLFVRPKEVAESMGELEQLVFQINEGVELNNQNLNDVALQMSKNHDKIKNQIQEFSNENLDQHSVILESIETGQVAVLQSIKSSQIAISERLDDQTGEIQAVNENINFMGTEQIAAIEKVDRNNTLDHGHIISELKTIKQITEDGFDELKKLVNTKIDSLNTTFKNNLYLVLRAISQVPGRTFESIQKERNIPRQSLYRYLSVLQSQNLIESQTIEESKKGRPKRKFFRK